MDDLISRQAAIDAVRSYYDEFDDKDESIENRIEKLPSAQPEPNRIPCSECKKYKVHDKRCKYWNHGVKPDDFCSKAEPWRGEEHGQSRE